MSCWISTCKNEPEEVCFVIFGGQRLGEDSNKEGNSQDLCGEVIV